MRHMLDSGRRCPAHLCTNMRPSSSRIHARRSRPSSGSRACRESATHFMHGGKHARRHSQQVRRPTSFKAVKARRMNGQGLAFALRGGIMLPDDTKIGVSNPGFAPRGSGGVSRACSTVSYTDFPGSVLQRLPCPELETCPVIYSNTHAAACPPGLDPAAASAGCIRRIPL